MKGRDPRQQFMRGDRCAVVCDDWITSLTPGGSNIGRGDVGKEVFTPRTWEKGTR